MVADSQCQRPGSTATNCGDRRRPVAETKTTIKTALGNFLEDALATFDEHEIAQELGISVRTLRAILAKFGFERRTRWTRKES